METAEKNEVVPLGIVEITESNLKLMKEQILEIPETPENKEQYATARDMHIQAKKVLPRIEERRKEIKAPHLEQCREVDATAKKAKGMIQPLIEMSGDRRAAWEEIAEKEKAVARAEENLRLDNILGAMRGLKKMIENCLEYNIPSLSINFKIQEIENYHIEESVFQEHFDEAHIIRDQGLLNARAAMKNRIAFEADLADLAKQQKAQDDAQATLDADNKAEAERLAKVDQDQKAEAARVKAEAKKQAKKVISDQKKAQAKIEKAMAELEALKTAERDRVWSEACQIHIAEYIMPVAIKMNVEFIAEKRAELAVSEQRAVDILRCKNAIEFMGRNITEIIDKAFPSLDVKDIKDLVETFGFDVEELISELNIGISKVK